MWGLKRHHILSIFNGALCASFVLTIACGGSSVQSEASVTLSATVNAPTTDSVSALSSTSSLSGFSIETSSAQAAVIEKGMPELNIKIYTIEGKLVGETTSQAEGAVSLNATFNDLKPSGTTSNEYTVTFVLVATNDAGTIRIESLVEKTINELLDTTIALGIADLESTLAAQRTRKKVGCNWGENCTGLLDNFDHVCFFKMQERLFEDLSATSTDGMDDDLIVGKELIRYGMAQGIMSFDLMERIQTGTASLSEVATVAEQISSQTGRSTDYYTSRYDNAVAAMQAIDTVVGDYMAQGAGLTTAFSPAALTVSDNSALSENQAATATLETGCQSARKSSDYVTGFSRVLKSMETPEKLSQTFADDKAMKAFLGVMDSYRQAGDYSKLHDAPYAAASYFENIDDFDEFFDGAQLRKTHIDGIYNVFGAVDPNTLETPSKMRAWAKSMENTIDNLSGGFDDLYNGGSFDYDSLYYYDGYFEHHIDAGTINFDSVDFANFAGDLDSDALSNGDGIFQCMSNGGTFTSCGGDTSLDPNSNGDNNGPGPSYPIAYEYVAGGEHTCGSAFNELQLDAANEGSPLLTIWTDGENKSNMLTATLSGSTLQIVEIPGTISCGASTFSEDSVSPTDCTITGIGACKIHFVKGTIVFPSPDIANATEPEGNIPFNGDTIDAPETWIRIETNRDMDVDTVTLSTLIVTLEGNDTTVCESITQVSGAKDHFECALPVGRLPAGTYELILKVGAETEDGGVLTTDFVAGTFVSSG